jgi:hypothetical protein
MTSHQLVIKTSSVDEGMKKTTGSNAVSKRSLLEATSL